MSNSDYKKIIEHYEDCLKKHGDNHLGVDWPKLEDVNKRYNVMLDIVRINKDSNTNVSILDFGCGTSHLLEFIKKNNYKNIDYSGLEISKKFIDIAKKKYPNNAYFLMDILEPNQTLPNFDYIIMNGVFTEKRTLSFDEMWSYFTKMLTIVYSKANKGICFNVMSKNVDWEREDLFHVSIDLLNDFLSKKLTRDFIIRNDYGLYEYTVYVFKNQA